MAYPLKGRSGAGRMSAQKLYDRAAEEVARIVTDYGLLGVNSRRLISTRSSTRQS